ncbi:MAG: S8 family serine peptidase [Anaerolineae bacterium]|nr:S8 family serine peptidase [Anaerolineae bacterium]
MDTALRHGNANTRMVLVVALRTSLVVVHKQSSQAAGNSYKSQQVIVLLRDVIREATRSGVIVISAAGNLDSNDSNDSNDSTYVNNGFAWWSGTSMAAPFVAGQVALIRKVAPSMSVLDIASLIAGTTRPVDALNPNYSGDLGVGRIPIGGCLGYLQTSGVPNIQQNLISQSCIN